MLLSSKYQTDCCHHSESWNSRLSLTLDKVSNMVVDYNLHADDVKGLEDQSSQIEMVYLSITDLPK